MTLRHAIDEAITPGDSSWRAALLHALPVTGLVLALLYYWFAVADRYRVFLYYHDMGPVVPDTSPFGFVTASRYWMTGLVAGGAVMVLYVLWNSMAAYVVASYRPPPWWRVWLPSAVVLAVAVPAVTMAVNDPTLPVLNAAQVTFAVLVALAIALVPGGLAARHPGRLVLLAGDGWGLALVMSSLVGLQHVRRWLDGGASFYVAWMAAIVGAGVVWLLVLTALCAWRRWPVPRARDSLMAGVTVAYLLLPLVHHVFGTDGYFYVSDSDNFFARSIPLQLGVWLVTAALAVGLQRLRARFASARQ